MSPSIKIECADPQALSNAVTALTDAGYRQTRARTDQHAGGRRYSATLVRLIPRQDRPLPQS